MSRRARGRLGACAPDCARGDGRGLWQQRAVGGSAGRQVGDLDRRTVDHGLSPAAVRQFCDQDAPRKDHHDRGRATTREGPAAETVTTDGQPVIDAVLVNEVADLRATSAVLENSLKLSASEATAYEGKWISLTVADPEYETVVNSLRPTQAIEQFVPEEPNLRVAGVTSIGGRSAVAVTGSPGAQVAAGDTALTTLFVDHRARPAHQLDDRGEGRIGDDRGAAGLGVRQVQRAGRSDRPHRGHPHLVDQQLTAEDWCRGDVRGPRR